MKKDFISVKDLESAEIEEIFLLTDKLKRQKEKFTKALSGKTIVLIFQKPSNRTRVSFEVGMYQLGGNALYLSPHEINLGVRESIHDVAKTISRYADAIVLRTYAHETILQMAESASVPVINGLSDFEHPCQALADVYTVREKLKRLKGIILAYVGDGNNVAHSLLYTCAKTGMDIHIGTPSGYEPKKEVVEESKQIAKAKKSSVILFDNPHQAVKNADVIYTDVWTSMGQEEEAQERKRIFRDFQVNEKLLRVAKPMALIMHCLPAHRGEEITDEVMDSKNSIVFDQAENRMHVQKAILIKLLGN
ncbi:MAG: ornithine carbamoyltransferase [Candidatus Omnitrophica bacterium]|nr:ornithine carbamoyltransferase [Candidatus Omnitrophota bacterium]